ncbi:hypothetical protein SAMN02927924_02861 [Sphingobium faniae]|nr:hypothetical protein SAMN02927924_02861 [Sphingobium faniae]
MNKADLPDENPIQDIPSEKWWSENFFAGFACPRTRTAIFYSIGRWHADPTLWRECVQLSLPDGTLAWFRGYGRNGTATAAGASVSSFEIVEPGNRIRVTFDGPMMKARLSDLIEQGAPAGPTVRCRFDIGFEGVLPVWNLNSDTEEARTMAGASHIDHVGAANGTIEFDGAQYPLVDAYAIRDHSRGVRDLIRFEGSAWLHGVFPSGRGFYVYAMKSPDGSMGMSNAAMVADGHLYPAEVVAIEFLNDFQSWGSVHTLVLRSEIGDMTIEFTDVLATFATGLMTPWDMCPGKAMYSDIGLVFDEPMRLRSGGEEGVGWSERGVPQNS